MMKVELEKKVYDLEEGNKIGFGGEGVIYAINDKICLKILNENLRTNSNKVGKILALCDKSDYMSTVEGFEQFALPLSPTYKENGLCGYSMKYFHSCRPLNDFSYQILDQRYPQDITDEKVLTVIRQLFRGLALLHRYKIILGDINPENILYSPANNKVHFVDIDSAQVGEFYSKATRDEYRCPTVEQMGKTLSGAYPYSTSSDIYSLAIVCFELVIGVHPYELSLNPILGVQEAKYKNISALSFHHIRKGRFNGYSIVDRTSYDIISERLDLIKRDYKTLYDFFLNVFYFQKRPYFENFRITERKLNRKEKHVGAIRERFTGHKVPDPQEFQLFLQMYNLTFPK